MKNISFILMLIGLVILTSCTKEEAICEEAVLSVCNTDTHDVVIYAWLSTKLEDTLWPGECTYQIVKNSIGNGTSEGFQLYHTQGGTLYILDDCEANFTFNRGFVDLQADCNNGKFDPWSGEADTDCGGFCSPCPPLVLPCNTQENRIEFSDPSLDNSANFFTINESIDEIHIKIEMNMAIINIRFSTKGFPKKSRKFITAANQGTMAPHEALIDHYDGWKEHFVEENQEIYLIKVDSNNWEIKFCDITFDFEGSQISSNAHFSFEHSN